MGNGTRYEILDDETVTYWREATEHEYRIYDIGDYYPEEDEDA